MIHSSTDYLAWNLGNTCTFIQILKARKAYHTLELAVKKDSWMWPSEETSCKKKKNPPSEWCCLETVVVARPQAFHISLLYYLESSLKSRTKKKKKKKTQEIPHMYLSLEDSQWEFGWKKEPWFLATGLLYFTFVQQTSHPPSTWSSRWNLGAMSGGHLVNLRMASHPGQHTLESTYHKDEACTHLAKTCVWMLTAVSEPFHSNLKSDISIFPVTPVVPANNCRFFPRDDHSPCSGVRCATITRWGPPFTLFRA